MKTLIVGIGSTILRDDGVGIHAARELRTRSSSNKVDIMEIGTAGLSILDLVEGYDRLIIIDAIVTNAPPGTIHYLTQEDMARAVHLGTGHEADLPTTLALGNKLMGGHMPKKIIVVAVEAGDIATFSEQLTPEVEAAILEVLDGIERLLEE